MLIVEETRVARADSSQFTDSFLTCLKRGRISRKNGSFLRPPHVRDFVKEGYFFVPRYVVWGGENPLTIHEIYAALTPNDSRSDWASEYAAAKQAQNYKHQ